MKARIRLSTPADESEIVALMRSAGLEVTTAKGWLHWKYWQERADWPGTRSFIVANESRILAHSGIIPGACVWNNKRATVIHMMDWAASADAVGAGIALMKYIGGLADALIGVGGSRYTRRALPMVGFRPCGSTILYARALRPWLTLQDASRWNWKTLPKFGRDLMRVLKSPAVEVGTWQATPLDRTQLESIASVLPSATADLTVLERSAALMAYFLDCPIAPMTLYRLERAGKRHGYFMLAFASRQARLVDCWVDSPDPSGWRSMVHCAVQAALHNPRVAELVTMASDPMLSQCLVDLGFHAHHTDAVMILPKPGLTAIPTNLRFQMLDSDAAFLF